MAYSARRLACALNASDLDFGCACYTDAVGAGSYVGTAGCSYNVTQGNTDLRTTTATIYDSYVTAEQVAKIGQWLDDWYNHPLLKMHTLTPWRGGRTFDSGNNELYLLPLTTAPPLDASASMGGAQPGWRFL